jgi:uncharacterized protein YbaA (DUF1428 family)
MPAATGDRMSYIDGFIIPVRPANKEAYKTQAQKSAKLFQEYGATQVVETWGDDIPNGKTTDFKMAVKAEGDEQIVFSWMVWPSKEVRDAAMTKMKTDPRWADLGEMPFDGKRMIFGGFVPLFDSTNALMK